MLVDLRLAGDEANALWAMADRLATVQASTMGLSDTFLICMLAVIPVILLSPLLPKRLAPRAGPAPAAVE